MLGRGEWSRSRDALVAGNKGIAEAVLVASLFGSRLFTLVLVKRSALLGLFGRPRCWLAFWTSTLGKWFPQCDSQDNDV